MEGKKNDLKELYDVIYKKSGDGKGKIYLTEGMYLLSDGSLIDYSTDDVYRRDVAERAKNSPNIYVARQDRGREYIGDGYSRRKESKLTGNEFIEL